MNRKIYFATLMLFTFFSLVLLNSVKAEDNELSKTHINIPNAFSPNDDGIDDEFQVIPDESIDVLNLKIFNRFGQIVWATNSNKPWDGKFQGQVQPIDTYIYIVEIKSVITGKVYLQKGDITLIR